jgi:hypothetical protein
MNKDKFIKKLQIGQKVITSESNSNENDMEQDLTEIKDHDDYIELLINKVRYFFMYNFSLRKNAYLVLDLEYNDLKTKQRVFKFFFFSKKDYDHFLTNKDFYVSKELLNVAKDRYDLAKWYLNDAKRDYKNSKKKLTN